jgi:hypothetical protein
MEKINALLHGYGTEYHSKFMRVKVEKVMHNDSVREFVMSYRFGFTDESSMTETAPHPAPPEISYQ